MNKKVYEEIIKQYIYDFIYRELSCCIHMRNSFMRKGNIKLYGARKSSRDGLLKTNFSMTNILIFDRDYAHNLDVFGIIDENLNITNFEVKQHKQVTRAYVYEQG